MRVASIVVLLAVAGGCVSVRPHERERLAHRAMQAPVWRDLARADAHTFDVREGSDGAAIDGGGGCGCN